MVPGRDESSLSQYKGHPAPRFLFRDFETIFSAAHSASYVWNRNFSDEKLLLRKKFQPWVAVRHTRSRHLRDAEKCNDPVRRDLETKMILKRGRDVHGWRRWLTYFVLGYPNGAASPCSLGGVVLHATNVRRI